MDERVHMQFSGNLAAIGQQGLMISQQIAHQTQASFVLASHDYSIPEAIAMGEQNRSTLPHNVAGLNTAHFVPVPGGALKVA